MEIGKLSTKRAMYTSIASAVIFLLSAIIRMIFFGAHASSRPNPDDFGGSWQVDYLKALWSWREGVVDLEICMAFMEAAGLFLFLYTVQVLREMYATEKGSLRHLMANAFIIGGLLRLFEFLQLLGIELGSRYVSEMDNLPDSAWVSLTVTHDLLRGFGAFVFVGDILSIILGLLILSYFSMRGTSEEGHRLSRRHGIFGIVLALFLAIVFIIEISAFMTYNPSRGDFIAAGVFGGIAGLALWPIWLIWLGVQLRKLELPIDKSQTQTLIANQQL